MTRLTIILLTLLVLGGCSSENEDLKKKILDLEKENGNLKKKILYLESENELDPDRFHKFIVDTCITKRKEITTFGAYTLTQIITDQDWGCIDDLRGYVSATETGFGLNGISHAFVESPEKVLFHSRYRGLKVKDIEEFYHVSEWTGGAWWAIRDVFLSKKAPYEIVFEEYSYVDGEGVVWKHFDDDGRKEIEIEITNFLHYDFGDSKILMRTSLYQFETYRGALRFIFLKKTKVKNMKSFINTEKKLVTKKIHDYK